MGMRPAPLHQRLWLGKQQGMGGAVGEIERVKGVRGQSIIRR